MRLVLSVDISVIGLAAPLPEKAAELACVRDVRPGAAVREVAEGRASWNSSMVPHCPHSGQRPYHLTPFQPHSEHTYCVAFLAMMPTLANFTDNGKL
jgi:hypothetical protein